MASEVLLSLSKHIKLKAYRPEAAVHINNESSDTELADKVIDALNKRLSFEYFVYLVEVDGLDNVINSNMLLILHTTDNGFYSSIYTEWGLFKSIELFLQRLKAELVPVLTASIELTARGTDHAAQRAIRIELYNKALNIIRSN